uniref:Uncharacterized protein n=1 Tax=Romanomermis culicivorax TaxID=13658 RepID=A0A915IN62_ROMCU
MYQRKPYNGEPRDLPIKCQAKNREWNALEQKSSKANVLTSGFRFSFETDDLNSLCGLLKENISLQNGGDLDDDKKCIFLGRLKNEALVIQKYS